MTTASKYSLRNPKNIDSNGTRGEPHADETGGAPPEITSSAQNSGALDVQRFDGMPFDAVPPPPDDEDDTGDDRGIL